MKKSYSIDRDSKGVSLRNFIKKKFNSLSTRDIEKLLAQNGCRLNRSIERFGSTKLKLGDQVEIFPNFPKNIEKEELKILFEDDYLLIINKPSGLSSSIKELEAKLNKTLYLAHRLDKQTSGVLILAKSQDALKKMEALFFNRLVHKKYLALVHGQLQQKKGVIEKPISLKSRYEGGVLYKTMPYGKEAITHFERLFSNKTESFLMLQPITGRTHQLRVHLDSIGHSILGDPVYRSQVKSTYHAPRLMLHARKIAFNHPFTDNRLEIIAPIPAMMRQVISVRFKNQKKCAY